MTKKQSKRNVDSLTHRHRKELLIPDYASNKITLIDSHNMASRKKKQFLRNEYEF